MIGKKVSGTFSAKHPVGRYAGKGTGHEWHEDKGFQVAEFAKNFGFSRETCTAEILGEFRYALTSCHSYRTLISRTILSCPTRCLIQ